MAAVANTMTTLIELGQKSILSWGCTTTFASLLWMSLASVVHIIATTSYALTRRKTKQRISAEESQQPKGRKQTASATRLIPDASKPYSISIFFATLGRAFKIETTVCANNAKLPYDLKTRVTRPAVLLNVIAGCGFIHIVFSTTVFSSLQLVSVWDVLNHILWRYIYIVSTVVRKSLT